jgi:plasmid stabilization system protein ParE
MMARVVVGKRAAEAVKRQANWLRGRNPDAARRYIEAVTGALRLLEEHPLAGAPNGFTQLFGDRRIVTGDHVISYDVEQDGSVVVHDVRHGRTLGTSLPMDDDPD